MKLLLIIGPPAVGKMSVGRGIADRTEFRLFHNHHTMEPLVEVFGYGSPPFIILNTEFRRRVIEEAAAHRLDLIFTFVWDLADPADTTYVENLVAPYLVPDAELVVVELHADLDTRLHRNRGETRLAAKPTKRNVEWSDANLRELEKHQLNTDPTGATPVAAEEFLRRYPHLRLDTTGLTTDETVDQVLAWLNAPPG